MFPGAYLGTDPCPSVIKDEPEEDPAVVQLRKAAGGVRTASVNAFQCSLLV